MNPGTYERVAVVLRYVFAAFGAFIALRSVYMCLKDGLRAAKLSDSADKYGAVAVLSVLPADRRGKAQEIPIGRNALVGSGARSDVRIRGMGLKGRHFDYEIRASKMYIAPLKADSVSYLGKRADEDASGTLVISPGERILAGRASIGFKMLGTPRNPASPMNSKVFKSKG
ncbi:MAG: hypothetical protein IJM56_00455 [Clostridia bacterium]|nr:hypothetical protein [Clostridia bacterium]